MWIKEGWQNMPTYMKVVVVMLVALACVNAMGYFGLLTADQLCWAMLIILFLPGLALLLWVMWETFKEIWLN